MKRLEILLVVGLVFAFYGCGGGSSATPAPAPVVSLALSSTSAALDQGQQKNLSATVTNDSRNAGVTWALSGPGTLSDQTTSSVTYKAPASGAAATATITVASVSDPTKTATITIQVSPMPTIAAGTSPTSGASGSPYDWLVPLTGGTGPFTWSISAGALPTGLTLDQAGKIAGTPGVSGDFNFTVKVQDVVGVAATQAYSLSISPAIPVITTPPADQIVIAGDTASFSVLAAGTPPLSYQWKRNNTAIAGATSSSYTLATVAADNGATFTVTVANAAGSVTSSAASLTVNILPAITTQPTNQIVNVGDTATFSVVATGTAPLDYQWNRNGTAISDATSSSYTTPATVAGDDNAQFTVTVTNVAGNLTSSAARLTVNTSVTVSYFGTQSPGDAWAWTITKDPHGSGTFSATNSTTAKTYSGNVATLPNNFLQLTITASTDNSASLGSTAYAVEFPNTALIVKPVGSNDAPVIAAAQGNCPTQAQSFNWIKMPNFTWDVTTDPAFGTASTAVNGSSFDFSISSYLLGGASPNSTDTLSAFSCNGGVIGKVESSAQFGVTPSGVFVGDQGISGGVIGMLQPPANIGTAGILQAGREFRGFIFMTHPPNGPDNNPVDKTQAIWSRTAGDSLISAGEYTDFAAGVEDGGSQCQSCATLSLDSEVAPGEFAGTMTDPHAGAHSFTLAVNQINGKYVVFGFSREQAGPDPNALYPFLILVMEQPSTIATPLAPAITTQPANQTVNLGQTATFSVGATGTAPVTCQWRKNGSVIGGATACSYTTPATIPGDDGATFTVKVINVAGNVTSNPATLAVVIPPAITTQPATQTLTEGQTATFTVAATGTAPLTYQWKNGATVVGANSNSYTTPAIALTDSGEAFTVTVSNPAGSVTSNGATLYVAAAVPLLSLGFNPNTIPLNGTSTLTFSITNVSASTVDAPLSDVLPSGLVVADTPGVVSGCGGTVTADPGSGNIYFLNHSLPVGPCSIQVNVKGTTAGNKNNTASIICNGCSDTPNTASASLTVVAPPSIAKAFGAPGMAVNGTTSLTFTLANPAANTVALTGVAFADTLPAGMIVATPNALANNCGGTVTAVAGSGSVALSGSGLAVNSACTLTVNVTAAVAASYINTTGAVTSTNGGTGNTASASLTVASPPVIAKAFGAGSIPLNGSTSLTFTITNPAANTIALSGIAFTDNLPAGLEVSASPGLASTCGGSATAGAGSTSVSLSAATLAANTSCTLSVNVTGKSGGVKNNSVTVSSTEAGAGNTSNASVTVWQPLSITKSFNPTLVAMNVPSTLTFVINNGNSTAVNASFTDAFTAPFGPMVVSTPPNISNTCGGTLTVVAGTSVVSYSNAALAVGSCTISLNVQDVVGDGHWVNSVTINSTDVGTGNTSTADLRVINPPSIAAAFGAATIPLNGATSLTFTITSLNPGASAMTGVGFTDNLPAGLVVATPTNLSNTCGGTATAAAASGTVSLANVDFVGNANCTLSLNVTGTSLGVKNNSVTVSSADAGTGNTSNASVIVTGPPTISKSFGAANILLNGSTSLSFTINNPNAGTGLTGVGFTDNLPSGLVVATPNNLTGACGSGTITADPGSHLVSLSGGNLDAAPSGLVSWWPADNDPADAAGGNNAILQNGASFTPNGRVGGAFNFTNPPDSPTGQFAQVSTPTGLPVGSAARTIDLWFKTPTDLNSHINSALISYGPTSPNARFGLVTSAGTPGKLYFIGNFNDLAGTTTLQPDTWYHAAVTYDGSSLVLYLNGQVENSKTTALLNTTLDSNGLTIGLWPGAATWNGQIDEVEIFNRALSQPEIQAIYNAGSAGRKTTSCTFAADVTGIEAGMQNNVTGNVTSVEAGPGGTASASVVVGAPPDIHKVFGQGMIPLNGSTSLTFTLTNPAANTIALNGVAFTDTFPAGMIVATPSGLSNTCAGTVTAVDGSGSVSLSGGSIPTNSSCTLTVNVAGTAPGSFINTTGAVTSANAGTGNTASANLTVASSAVITKSFDVPSVPLGGISSLNFTITNPAGNAVMLTGINFTDNLPSGLAVATGLSSTCGGTPSAVTGSSTVSLSGAALAVNASCTMTVNVTATTGGAKNNSVMVSSSEGGTGNTSSASLNVIGPPTISKSFGAASILLNGSTTLSFTLQNPNPTTTLTGVGFTDTLPAGLVISNPNGLAGNCGGAITATQGSSSVFMSGASLGPNGSCTFSVNVTGTAGGVKNNTTGNVTSIEGGSGETASASVTVISTSQVSGRVMWINSGSGMPGITLTINTTPEQTTTTDGTGNYSFSNVPNGSYTVTPSMVGPSSVFLPTFQPVTVNNASVTADFFGNLGYTVSGTVTYAGPSGRVYLGLQGGNSGFPLGTSIAAPGAFTIRGVPPGTYTLQAGIDNIGFGVQNASNPAGSVSGLTVSNADLSGVGITLSDPGPPSITTMAPTIQIVAPADQAAAVFFQAIKDNNNQVELPSSYRVQWSTTPDFSANNFSTNFPATGGDQPYFLNASNGLSGLVNGTPLYFRMCGLIASGTGLACQPSASGNSLWSNTFPVTLGAPTGANTVSGTYTFTGTATGPLYIGFFNESTGIYTTVIPNPVSGQTYTVNGVPTAAGYFNFGIIDQNNDGIIGPGDISNLDDSKLIAINGNTVGQDLVLPSGNSAVVLTTNHNRSVGQGPVIENYGLSFDLRGIVKLPVAVALTSGRSVITPMDIAARTDRIGRFQFWPYLSSARPTAGDTYVLHVTYSDGTAEDLSPTVSSVSDAFAISLLPSGTGGGNITPTFTWADPANPSNYVYSFNMFDTNGNTIWYIPTKSNGFDSSITSITWGTDPTGASNPPSVPSLVIGTPYQWNITTYDANGNSASKQVGYQP